MLWSKAVSDYVYHGTAVGDIDKNGKPELIFGDYNGVIYVLNGETGSTLWTYQSQVYVWAPVTIADLNQDGFCDVIFCDVYGVGALDRFSNSMWYYAIPNFRQSFRGVAVADINGDWKPDVVFGTNTVSILALKGANGNLHWTMDLKAHIGKTFDINHAPFISDFDADELMDVFVLGGSTDYPNFSANYGRAYLLSTGPGHGPDWLMFQHDVRRQSNVCEYPVGINEKHEEMTLNIYPNPSSGMVHFSGSFNGLAKVIISSSQCVTQLNVKGLNPYINLSFLSTGIFVLEYREQNKIIRKCLRIY